MTAGGPTYATENVVRPTPAVSPDHVFENSLLGSFFAFALGQPGAPTCASFNTIFVDSGLLQEVFDVSLPGRGQCLRLTDSVQNLANVNNPDFAALDRFINRVKANFFATTGAPRVGQLQYATAIENLQNFGVAADFLGFHDTIALFRRTHQRLYQKFGAIDQFRCM